MIPLFKVYMSPEAKKIVGETLDSGYVGQGPRVEEFEKMLREWFGNKYVNTTSSCTEALHLALQMAKAKCGSGKDEVITTPLTCSATNTAIVGAGLKIRWADVDPDTCNIDVDDVARKIGPKTLAIMVVHWGGTACDLNKLRKIQLDAQVMFGYRPPVIEDAAHAWGASFHGKLIGNHGNYCCFSFQAIKHLTCGDGGMVISPDEYTHEEIKLLRWYGLDRTSATSFRCSQNIHRAGGKHNMNDIAASIGIANLPESKKIVEAHQDNANFYWCELPELPGIKIVRSEIGGVSSYWVYTIRVERRADFVKHMTENGVEVSQVHRRNDQHSCFFESRSMLPGMDALDKDMIAIPVGWWVTTENRQHVVDTIKKGW